MIDRERLVRDMFERYRVAVGVDDPLILACLTHEAIYESVAEQIQGLLQNASAEIEAISERYLQQSDAMGQQTAAQAARMIKTQLEQTMPLEADKVVQKLSAMVDRTQTLVERAEHIQTTLFYTAFFTGFTAAAGAALIWLQLRGWL